MEPNIEGELITKKRFRKYKFTNKKHSRGGMISSACGAVAIIFILVAINISFKTRGDGGALVAVLGFLSFLISLYGMVKGLKSFKVEDNFYGFSWLGVILNVFIWLFTAYIIVMGI